MPLQTTDVFGLRTRLSDHSYVDRGNLDSQIQRMSRRDAHIALKGESKSGKSWLRQKNFPEAVVVQCRIEHNLDKIYTDILRALGVSRVLTGELGRREISFGASSELGRGLLAAAAAKLGFEVRLHQEKSYTEIGGGADDLPFIVEVVKSSGRRIVIEDFHYLDDACRVALAQDLKALWDFGVYLIIVGIWRHMNYLTYLNPDLAGRMIEVNLYWSESDLTKSLEKGAVALNCTIDPRIVRAIVENSYGNIGLLQALALHTLEAFDVHEHDIVRKHLIGMERFDTAGMVYANQLEAQYTHFAERVSRGIRQRRNSTRIYAHAMWTLFELPDETLLEGASCDLIFRISHDREPRIQKGNLRAVLRKFDELQVDAQGKGLVLTFDEGNDVMLVVDRTVLFFRRYRTFPWPWEVLATESEDIAPEMGFGGPD